MAWRDEVGKMLDEREQDCRQDYRRAIGSNIDDAKHWKARQALDTAIMNRECFVDGRAYGAGSGNSDDYSKPQGNDNPRKAPYGEYTMNKWGRKRYG